MEMSHRPEAGDMAGRSFFADALCAVDGVDGTHESLTAVEHAARLAGPGGQLTLLLVTSQRTEGDRRSPAITPLDAKDVIDHARAVAQKAGVSCTVEVDPAAPPAQVILGWAAGRDLLAIGAPAASWFGGLFLGGVAVTAETMFTTPLLVARSDSDATPSGPVLVASDGEAGSDDLVELAGAIARGKGVPAILLHVVGAESHAHPHRIQEQLHRLEQAMSGAASLRIEVGNARGSIVEAAAAEAASMIVMSSRRLSGLAVIGSVSRRVVHQAHCSVLLIPPERLPSA